MPSLILDNSGNWVPLTKEEIMQGKDIEGKSPCSHCWEEARDKGMYVFPLKPEALAKVKRCPQCGRLTG